MNVYKKRFLTRPGQLFSLMKGIRSHTGKTNAITPALAEKVRLAVSAVTNCVNCSYLHTRFALEKGVSGAEVIQILKGELGDFPEYEYTALLYGQHWAQTGGRPGADIRARVAAYYGEEKTKHLETIIRVLYMGNMISNTVEAHQRGMRPMGHGIGFFLVYLLCLPMAFFIRVSGARGRAFLKDKKIDFLS
jgi:AhpD family alkylhydroperoxidase